MRNVSRHHHIRNKTNENELSSVWQHNRPPISFSPRLSAKCHGLFDRHFVALQKLMLRESLFSSHDKSLAVRQVSVVWIAFASGTFFCVQFRRLARRFVLVIRLVLPSTRMLSPVTVAARRFDIAGERNAFGGRRSRSLGWSQYVGQCSFERAAAPPVVFVESLVTVPAVGQISPLVKVFHLLAAASPIGNVGSLAAGRRAAGLISAAGGIQ